MDINRRKKFRLFMQNLHVYHPRSLILEIRLSTKEPFRTSKICTLFFKRYHTLESKLGNFRELEYNRNTVDPLLTLFFETLEKQPCKQRSDLVLNGQMRVPR